MADAVQFLLGDRPQAAEGVPPTMTVLDYLRTVLRRCGTKEGCAEGDCGACTVVLAEPQDGRLSYRAVNACLLFLPALDGKQLLTVEDLRQPDGTLHPVQQALVDEHGSQCGFCTPGFVMSLFALWHRDGGDGPAGPDDDAIQDALVGNLCRCTGYRPILDAARRIGRAGAGRGDAWTAREAATLAALAGLRRERMLDYRHGDQRFLAPRSAAELAEVIARHPEATLLAGGTDVGLWVTKQHRRPATLVHLGAVEGLDRVETTAEGLVIGGAATYAAALGALERIEASLGELVRRIGSEQIRNLGTIGGNIANASPIGDTLPALLALGARLTLRSASGVREVPLDGFFLGYRRTALGPGEFIERIVIPPRPSGRIFQTYKVSKRFDQDISAVCGAFAIDLDGGRVARAVLAYGGMAAVPQRAAAAERALLGRVWGAAAVRSAMAAIEDDFAPIDDMRASARYRRLVARNLLWRLQLETGPEAARGAAAPVAPTQVYRHAG